MTEAIHKWVITIISFSIDWTLRKKGLTSVYVRWWFGMYDNIYMQWCYHINWNFLFTMHVKIPFYYRWLVFSSLSFMYVSIAAVAYISCKKWKLNKLSRQYVYTGNIFKCRNDNWSTFRELATLTLYAHMIK